MYSNPLIYCAFWGKAKMHGKLGHGKSGESYKHMFYCKTRYWVNTKRHVISRDTVNRGPVNRGITVSSIIICSVINPIHNSIENDISLFGERLKSWTFKKNWLEMPFNIRILASVNVISMLSAGDKMRKCSHLIFN